MFLINPNGIIFGPNASLAVGGSFVATTANAVRLGDTGGIFSASEPATSNLLTVNPSALLFAISSQAGIVNSSRLLVPTRSLLLVGGDVALDGGSLLAPDGRIELGGLAGAGTVGLSNIDLSADSIIAFDDISSLVK